MKIAILIDAENVQPVFAEQIFSHASKLGDVVYKELYGAAQALNSWVEPVLRYAIHPNLTIRPSKYKNSSDIALVIGAMDLIGKCDTVIIASSDSDFSSLSVRLRSCGQEVIGMGTEKANPLWKTACSAFVTLSLPKPQPKPQQTAKPAQTKPQQPALAAAKPQETSEKPQERPQAQEKPQDKAQDKPLDKPQEAAKSQAKPESKPESTHAGRAQVIRAFIKEQLTTFGGKVPSSQLFTALNGLNDYRVDQQRSHRKPMDYIRRQYGDAFRFEESEEGTFLVEAMPAKEVPAPSQEALELSANEPVSQNEPVSDEVALLVQAGIPEERAHQIAEIFSTSKDMRTAYNSLRATFGQKDGSRYYQTVKDLAEKVQQ
ncbi:MAG: NYN domain-containing protein [Clostridiales bacterium]|nr:NYN domain-containing protein [Clostridiales bacterium]